MAITDKNLHADNSVCFSALLQSNKPPFLSEPTIFFPLRQASSGKDAANKRKDKVNSIGPRPPPKCTVLPWQQPHAAATVSMPTVDLAFVQR